MLRVEPLNPGCRQRRAGVSPARVGEANALPALTRSLGRWDAYPTMRFMSFDLQHRTRIGTMYLPVESPRDLSKTMIEVPGSVLPESLGGFMVRPQQLGRPVSSRRPQALAHSRLSKKRRYVLPPPEGIQPLAFAAQNTCVWHPHSGAS